MNILQTAPFAVLILSSIVANGQEGNSENRPEVDRTTDEIVVVGRSVTTTTTRIEVEREMLVDSATVLRDVPGANVNSNGLITGIAQYRGMYGDRVSVAIDQLGMITGGPNAMDTPLSYMSPMITEELVVDRGIASVSSSPESIGGYISTKLARGAFGDSEFGLTGQVGTRYSDNGDIGTSAGRLTVADKNHRLSLVAELDSANDVSTPVGDIRPSGLNRERYDLSYAFNSGDNDLLVFAGMLDTSDAGTAALPMDIRIIDTSMFGLQFGTRFNEALRLESRFAYNDVEHLMDNFSLRQAPMPMMYRQNLAHGSGSQFHIAGIVDAGDSELRVGIDGIMADHNAVITNPNMPMFEVSNFTDVQRDVFGVFGEWTRDFDSSNVEFGLRYKQVKTDSGTVGAMGMPAPMATNAGMLADTFNLADRSKHWNSVDAVLKYHHAVSDRTEWMVEVGSKTRAPSYQELYLWLPLEATAGLADGRSYIGDLDLEEERSNEIVVGVTSAINRFSLSPQIFFRKVDNYIQGVPSTSMLANMVSTMMTGAPALQFANVDAEIWGADIAWKFNVDDKWSLDGIASYSRGKRTDINDNLYRLAPFNGSVGLTYASELWSIKPEIVFYAKQDNVSTYNAEQPSASYEVVNAAFEWHPLDSLRVEARIDNLLDETYQDHLAGRNRAMGSDIPVGERLYSVGRMLSVGLLFSF